MKSLSPSAVSLLLLIAACNEDGTSSDSSIPTSEPHPSAAGGASGGTPGTGGTPSGGTEAVGGAGGSAPAQGGMGGGAAGTPGASGSGGQGGAVEGYTEDPGIDGNGDHTVGPNYAIDPDLTDRGNPKGRDFQFTMSFADSKIYKGDDPTLEPELHPVRTERTISVYVPDQYKDGTEAPVLVILDGPGQLKNVRLALDNLTISQDPNRKLPAFIAVAVQNGGDDGKNSQRGLEYDTMSDRFARFINDEVLVAVLNNPEIKAAYPGIAFTQNPWGKAAMGCSSGGAAVLSMGWFRPDLFRRLITYSGTFVDQQDDDAPEEAMYPLGAWEYHSSLKLIETTPKKPLRIFTHVAENDLRKDEPEETYHNWVMANQRTAAALKTAGYDYRYVYSLATGHCAGPIFDQTLADTLVWMWRGYHAD